MFIKSKMSNEEIVSKFRNMMNRRKEEEVKKKTELLQDGSRKSSTNMNSDSNYESQVTHSTEVSNSTNNESITTSSQTVEEQKEKPAKPQVRPRSSVFDIAKRFEKKSEEEATNKPLQNLVAGPKNIATIKPEQEAGKEQEKENVISKPIELAVEKVTNEPINQETTEPENVEPIPTLLQKAEEILVSNKRTTGRNSTYRNLKERNSTTKNILTARSAVKEDFVANEIQSNTATTGTINPRKSVKDLIFMNENRLKVNKDNLSNNPRNSDTQFIGKNLSNIKRLIDKIKESGENGENFMENNAEELEKLGVGQKGFRSVEQLVDYYNNLMNKQPVNTLETFEARKQRNSVSPQTRHGFVFGSSNKDESDQIKKRSTSFQKSDNLRFLASKNEEDTVDPERPAGRMGVYANRNPNLNRLKDSSVKDVAANDESERIQPSKNSVQGFNHSITNNESGRASYQKNIINSLNSISIQNYHIGVNIPLDPTFFDILCTNCYECVKPNEVDRHSDYCIMQPEDSTYTILL